MSGTQTTPGGAPMSLTAPPNRMTGPAPMQFSTAQTTPYSSVPLPFSGAPAWAPARLPTSTIAPQTQPAQDLLAYQRLRQFTPPPQQQTALPPQQQTAQPPMMLGFNPGVETGGAPPGIPVQQQGQIYTELLKKILARQRDSGQSAEV